MARLKSKGFEESRPSPLQLKRQDAGATVHEGDGKKEQHRLAIDRRTVVPTHARRSYNRAPHSVLQGGVLMKETKSDKSVEVLAPQDHAAASSEASSLHDELVEADRIARASLETLETRKAAGEEIDDVVLQHASATSARAHEMLRAQNALPQEEIPESTATVVDVEPIVVNPTLEKKAIVKKPRKRSPVGKAVSTETTQESSEDALLRRLGDEFRTAVQEYGRLFAETDSNPQELHTAEDRMVVAQQALSAALESSQPEESLAVENETENAEVLSVPHESNTMHLEEPNIPSEELEEQQTLDVENLLPAAGLFDEIMARFDNHGLRSSAQELTRLNMRMQDLNRRRGLLNDEQAEHAARLAALGTTVAERVVQKAEAERTAYTKRGEQLSREEDALRMRIEAQHKTVHRYRAAAEHFIRGFRLQAAMFITPYEQKKEHLRGQVQALSDTLSVFRDRNSRVEHEILRLSAQRRSARSTLEETALSESLAETQHLSEQLKKHVAEWQHKIEGVAQVRNAVERVISERRNEVEKCVRAFERARDGDMAAEPEALVASATERLRAAPRSGREATPEVTDYVRDWNARNGSSFRLAPEELSRLLPDDHDPSAREIEMAAGLQLSMHPKGIWRLPILSWIRNWRIQRRTRQLRTARSHQ